jgi:hypothetical protein
LGVGCWRVQRSGFEVQWTGVGWRVSEGSSFGSFGLTLGVLPDFAAHRRSPPLFGDSVASNEGALCVQLLQPLPS